MRRSESGLTVLLLFAILFDGTGLICDNAAALVIGDDAADARIPINAYALKSLTSKLIEARDALARGNIKTAMNKLQDFIGQVRSQTGKHVALDAAQLLTADAQYVPGHL